MNRGKQKNGVSTGGLPISSRAHRAQERIEQIAAGNGNGQTRDQLLNEAKELAGLSEYLHTLADDQEVKPKTFESYGILVVPNESKWVPGNFSEIPPIQAHHLLFEEAVELALRINRSSIENGKAKWASAIRHSNSKQKSNYGVLSYNMLPAGNRPNSPEADNPLITGVGTWEEVCLQRHRINRQTMRVAHIPRTWAVVTRSILNEAK